MTVRIMGPTNHPEKELCDLSPGDGFIDPQDEKLYIYLEEDGGVVDCFQLHPCLGTITLSGHLQVCRAEINIEWGYA